MADLVADVRLVDYTQVKALFVPGNAAIDDGGGGLYIWNASSSAADDGAEIIKPTAIDSGSPGRWQRVSKNVEDYSPAGHNHDGVYQPSDATLTALAALGTTPGVVYQTGADTFDKKALGTTSGTIAEGDHTHAGYQTSDATLTALAALGTSAGVLYQTGADTFEKRSIGTTSNTIAAGDHGHLSAQANNAFTSGPLFWTGTQAQYDALTPDSNTVYVIV